jgi:tripartite-type tricarboxylate transporter receptor subunit TctC
MHIARRGLAALAITLALSGSAFAQAWPNKPIRMIVPYTPGGYTDLMARTVGQKLSEALGVPFIYENKPGANAIIGTDQVVKAAPDGYTFGTVIAAHSVNPTLNPKIPYDTMKDITYVSLMSSAPLIIIANKSLPANNIQELIALAKQKPGELNFASSGIGAAAHLTMEMFKSRMGINMQHVPYRGGAPMTNDLVGGQVNVGFDVMVTALPQVKSGRLRALGVLSPKRFEALPDVAAVAETLPGYEANTWAGVGVPQGTPPEIIERLNREVNDVLAQPEIKARFADVGTVPMVLSATAFKAYIAVEFEKWDKVVKVAGIKLD